MDQILNMTMGPVTKWKTLRLLYKEKKKMHAQ